MVDVIAFTSPRCLCGRAGRFARVHKLSMTLCTFRCDHCDREVRAQSVEEAARRFGGADDAPAETDRARRVCQSRREREHVTGTLPPELEFAGMVRAQRAAVAPRPC